MRDSLVNPTPRIGLPEETGASTVARVQEVSCVHCGDRVPRARAPRKEGEAAFCCAGCEAVFGLLAELDLADEYYGLKNGKRAPFKPLILEEGTDYAALDEPPYRERLDVPAELDIFLEGIHCAACVWLLERLPELAPGFESARLDMGRSILRVRARAGGKFEDAARLLLRLGYRPHPVRGESEARERLEREDRKTLRRLGITAFAAMNVMIYSISLYSGVDGREGTLFRVLSLVTALPALTYGAWPFYRNAWGALRSGRISIDLPISLAFIGGYAESFRQAWIGTNLLYLDSLTSLAFLLGASRYALARLERSETSKSGLLRALLPTRATRILALANGNEKVERVRPEELRVGDLVELAAGARVPADGTVERGGGWLDLSFLSGESKPVRVLVGDAVFAGARFLDGDARARVSARGGDTRLGSLETRIDSVGAGAGIPRRNARTERSDRWATLFLASVLGFCGLMMALYGKTDAEEAIRRSLSLLIIACPCALALATPLTLARAFRWAASRGILIRDPEALERALEIREVVFDKTGTLTAGRPVVSSWVWSAIAGESERGFLKCVAYTLETDSRHPYGRAIAAVLENDPAVRALEVRPTVERGGMGVELLFEGKRYRIGRPERDFVLPDGNDRETLVEFRRDGELLAEIALRDPLRVEAADAVRGLRKRRLDVRVLSGDAESVAASVAREVGVAEWRGRLTPEGKEREIRRLENRGRPVLAIGDGVNDALALRAAHVGVAFNRGGESSIEASLAGASVALPRPSLEGLVDFLAIASAYRRTLLRNASFSVAYNLVGAAFAVSGFVHPLVAAIAMPVSALTVFLSTVWSLRDRGGHDERRDA